MKGRQLRLATVLSARPWEADLVAYARETGAVRLVLRAYRPDEIDENAADIDAVVAGPEVAWVTAARIAGWRRQGLVVIGVAAPGDAPARETLRVGGADEVLADTSPPDVLVNAARFAIPPNTAASTPEQEAELVAVVGPRGGAGVTEVAVALAWEWSRDRDVLLLDLDVEAPALAIRLGIDSRPDLVDAADAARSRGELPDSVLRRVGPLRAVVGSHRPGEPPLRAALIEDVVAVARGRCEVIVADLGPAAGDDAILKQSDHAVLVTDAGPVGVVRASRLAAEWAGPPPTVVVNRARRGDDAEVDRAVRRWLGTEVAVRLPDDASVTAAARSARPPRPSMRRRLRRLQVPR